MANNNGSGPWGGGGDNEDDKSKGKNNPWGGNQGSNQGNNRPGQNSPVPDLDKIVRKGQEQLRVLMGGRTRMGGGGGPVDDGTGGGGLGRGAMGLVALAALGLWAFASFYQVQQNEKSIELFFGKFSDIGEPGLNFAPC